ncbi:MAG: LysR family transcriptional regulator [Rhodopseudomonas sp.]|nr:LysR family transcriptional regulator [Rhodopseudomonas sp.]
MGFDGRLLGGIGVLAAVVEAGNFVGAARALGLTQSGISRAVARLEAAVGVRLFERNARAVTLTDEGRRFYDSVAPLLSDLDQAVSDVGRASKTVRGHLRVSINPLIARMLVASRLPAFMTAYPELSVDINARDDARGLVADGFDVAVRFGEPVLSGQIVRRLGDSRIVTCASPAYLARHGRPRHPRDVAQHECILFPDPATGRPFTWEFHRKGKILDVPVTGRLTVNDGDTMMTVCEQGYGLAQSFEFAAPSLRDGRLVNLFPDWNEERFPLYVHFPSRRQQPAKVRAFVDFIAEAVKSW